jgi:hypothetical protein
MKGHVVGGAYSIQQSQEQRMKSVVGTTEGRFMRKYGNCVKIYVKEARDLISFSPFIKCLESIGLIW